MLFSSVDFKHTYLSQLWFSYPFVLLFLNGLLPDILLWSTWWLMDDWKLRVRIGW